MTYNIDINIDEINNDFSIHRSKCIRYALAHYFNALMLIHAKSLEIFKKLQFELNRVETLI